MALACSIDSREVPSGLMRWRGSSISVIRAATSCAGQSRAIRVSRAVVGIGRGADHADDLVDIGDRDGEADQDVGAVARLVEQELGAARHHLFAEGDEGVSRSFRFIICGRPPLSATMLAPKLVCSGVKR